MVVQWIECITYSGADGCEKDKMYHTIYSGEHGCEKADIYHMI